MILEYRSKTWFGDPWEDVVPGLKFENFNIDEFSVRINKDKQYHRIDTPGFKEAYNEAMSWIMLTNVNHDN